jgi:thioredoxin-dependent peroxiredoxin
MSDFVGVDRTGGLTRRSLLGSIGVGLVLGAMGGAIGLPRSAGAMGGKQPPIGSLAPGFRLPTDLGTGEISLSDYLGQWVVLYFYPKDFTSGCTLEAQRFQKDMPTYAARKVQVLGVSVDDVDRHAEFGESEGLTFPLLADVDGAVSKAYGSWMAPYSMRHSYIIDPEGKVQAVFLAVQPAIHSQEVLAKLTELGA